MAPSICSFTTGVVSFHTIMSWSYCSLNVRWKSESAQLVVKRYASTRILSQVSILLPENGKNVEGDVWEKENTVTSGKTKRKI